MKELHRFFPDGIDGKINESIALSKKYWKLLKKSKNVIVSKKDKLKSLLDCTKEWKYTIGKLQNKVKVNHHEIEFGTYVCEQYKKYLDDHDKMKKIVEEWGEIKEKLEEEESFWDNKKEEIDEANFIEDFDIISDEAKNLVDRLRTGWKNAKKIIKKKAKQMFGAWVAECQEQKIANMMKIKAQTQLEAIKDSSCKMTQDSSTMEALFEEFVQQMTILSGNGNNLKAESDKVSRNEANYFVLQDYIKSIVRTYGSSLETIDSILVAIDEAQHSFIEN